MFRQTRTDCFAFRVAFTWTFLRSLLGLCLGPLLGAFPRSFIWPLLGAFTCALFLPNEALARVQYALRLGVADCTACHVNPIGAGIRNLDGKFYGTHGLKRDLQPWADRFQINFRNVIHVPEEYWEDRGGLGLMEWMGSLNWPVEKSDDGKETHFVAAYNYGGFLTGLRDAYVLWQRSRQPKPLHHVLFGRFNAPFGLINDEHRTSVRIQSKTTVNDFYMGALMAGEFFETLHYDLALVNGFQQNASEGGGNFSTGLRAGNFVNLRWVPLSAPLILGASTGYFWRRRPALDPWAFSLYLGLSLDRLTDGWAKVSVLTEASRAQRWNDADINPDLGARFLPPGNLLPADIKNRDSEGLFTEVDWDITQRFTLLYKYDWIKLAGDLPQTAFSRHGIGFRHYPLPYLELVFRQEFAWSSIAGLPSGFPAAQNATWVLVHFWY